MKGDENLVLEAIQSKPKAIIYAPSFLKCSKMFVEKAVLHQPISLCYVDEKLKEDIDIIDNAFS